MSDWKKHIDLNQIPQHIAIIMDGNGRWAKKRLRNRAFGHQNGVQAVRDTTEACAELGVGFLTLYAFSTENWSRPKTEINALMRLLVATINKETKTLLENDIRLKAIGNIESLPKGCREELAEAMEKTANGKKMCLNLALSYSSRWDIMNASKLIIKDVMAKKVHPDLINEATISKYLSTRNTPDPELLIRTSGENRLSNYLLWESAYTELYFTETLWPDFNKDELAKAIIDYQHRERRFGKISEQLDA